MTSDTSSHATATEERRALLLAALGLLQLPTQRERALTPLRGWLDRWTAVAMRAEHQVLRLERSGAAWTAAFTYTGPTQLPPAAPSGLATAPTPGQAVQFAAWQVVRRDL